MSALTAFACSVKSGCGHLVTCWDCRLPWHRRSHSVPHLPLHLSVSYHCEVLTFQRVCFNVPAQTMDVCCSQISSGNYISFSPLSFLFLSSSSLPPSLTDPLWNLPGWRSVFDPTSWYTQRCQTHFTGLTHAIRWVNPIQSAGSEENQVNSPLNPGCCCLIPSKAFLLKLVSFLE